MLFVSHNMASIQSPVQPRCCSCAADAGSRWGPPRKGRRRLHDGTRGPPRPSRSTNAPTAKAQGKSASKASTSPISIPTAPPPSTVCAPVRFDLRYEKTGRLGDYSFHIGVHDTYGRSRLSFQLARYRLHVGRFGYRRHRFMHRARAFRCPRAAIGSEVAVLGEHRVIDRVYDALIIDIQVADFYGSGDMSSAELRQVFSSITPGSWTRTAPPVRTGGAMPAGHRTLIPMYNAADTILDALKSILSERDVDLEVVVCRRTRSTDGSRRTGSQPPRRSPRASRRRAAPRHCGGRQRRTGAGSRRHSDAVRRGRSVCARPDRVADGLASRPFRLRPRCAVSCRRSMGKAVRSPISTRSALPRNSRTSCNAATPTSISTHGPSAPA